jgi:hypothetical protein
MTRAAYELAFNLVDPFAYKIPITKFPPPIWPLDMPVGARNLLNRALLLLSSSSRINELKAIAKKLENMLKKGHEFSNKKTLSLSAQGESIVNDDVSNLLAYASCKDLDRTTTITYLCGYALAEMGIILNLCANFDNFLMCLTEADKVYFSEPNNLAAFTSQKIALIQQAISEAELIRKDILINTAEKTGISEMNRKNASNRHGVNEAIDNAYIEWAKKLETPGNHTRMTAPEYFFKNVLRVDHPELYAYDNNYRAGWGTRMRNALNTYVDKGIPHPFPSMSGRKKLKKAR